MPDPLCVMAGLCKHALEANEIVKSIGTLLVSPIISLYRFNIFRLFPGHDGKQETSPKVVGPSYSTFSGAN